jgi:protein phosphatase
MTNNTINKITAVSRTHPGQVRKINEDSIFSFVRDPERGSPIALLIVADGIGGHKAGDIASNLAVQTVFNELAWFLDEDAAEQTKPLAPPPDFTDGELDIENYLETRLRMAIQDANLKIHEYADSHPEQASNMGTTFSCLLIFSGKLVVAHIGDSRAYRLRSDSLEQLTDDHSFVGQMVRDGQLPTEAYYVHPRRNVITRALGQFADVNVDLSTEVLEAGDRYLICSDGLWEMIRDPELQQHLRDLDDMEATVEALIELAVERGGPDNISVVIAEVE